MVCCPLFARRSLPVNGSAECRGFVGRLAMKSATAYSRRGKIFIHSSSKTKDGVWVLSEPVISIGDVVDSIAVGASVRQCLNGARIGVDHPKSFSGLFSPVLKLAKARSYKEFAREAKCVEIVEDGGVIGFFPTENHGVDEGFVRLGEARRISRSEGDLQVGQALLDSIAEAK